jgi:hypothetical protein
MFVQLESRCGVGFLAKPDAEKLLLRKIGRKPYFRADYFSGEGQGAGERILKPPSAFL